MKRNYQIGIIASVVAVVLISIPVYLYWMYSPEAVYRRGLASAFWLSLENDTRDVIIEQGQTKTMPVELHHWKDLDTALYLTLDDGGRSCEFPVSLSVSFDPDSSVVSLSKGAIGMYSKNQFVRENPPQIKKISSDGEMVVRDIGWLTVSATKDVSLGSYFCGLSSGDTNIIDGAGGNTQLLTITVVESSEITVQDISKVKVYLFPRNTTLEQDAGKIAHSVRNELGIKLAADYGVNTGASRSGIYDLEGNIIVPNGVEFYIHPDVRKSDGSQLLEHEINEDQSLGNGVVVGDINIKPIEPNSDSELIPAIWIVVAEPDIEKADANIGRIDDIINNSN